MTGRRIGLVIGNNYPEWDKDKQLKFAVADAIKMKEILENKDICYFDDVVLLTNKTSREAQIEIEKLFRNAGQDDLIFIYFSGHGKKDFTNDLYLLFEDTNEESPMTTSLAFEFINKCRKYPQALKASIVIVLDCCYSAAAGLKSADMEETLASYCSTGTVILTSTGSTGSSIAREDDELGHSFFTYYLIEGLEKGHADKNGEGKISIDELYNYAFDKTKKSCSQFPLKKGNIEGTFVIGKNPLKIRKREFELKIKRLCEGFANQLPHRILDESLTVLRKNYEDPFSVEKTEIEIYRLLESLLEGELSAENYSMAVQHMKGANINYLPSQNENPDYILKPEVQNYENSEVCEISIKHDIPIGFVSPSTDIEFVFIPTGSFIMGSPQGEKGRFYWEDSAHEVTIKDPFYIGKYPVTIRQWMAVMMDSHPYSKNNDKPVVNVSWNDAQEFIKKLNEKENTDKYRLPSEAEWEYACRAGKQTRFFFGDYKFCLRDYAWYYKNSDWKTHLVGKKGPNPWCLYDMYGNVDEWVQDVWHNNYDGAPTDGSVWEDGDSSERVCRGGNNLSDAAECRSASRDKNKIEIKNDRIGFRLVRDL